MLVDDDVTLSLLCDGGLAWPVDDEPDDVAECILLRKLLKYLVLLLVLDVVPVGSGGWLEDTVGAGALLVAGGFTVGLDVDAVDADDEVVYLLVPDVRCLRCLPVSIVLFVVVVEVEVVVEAAAVAPVDNRVDRRSPTLAACCCCCCGSSLFSSP